LIKYVVLLFVVTIPLIVVTTVLDIQRPDDVENDLFQESPPLIGVAVVTFVVIQLFSGGFGMLVWWGFFAPRRPTDLFYLRSFRNDSVTWPIRVAIQDVIGSRWRLSGIRDPDRRQISNVDRFTTVTIAMKYCTPRYMDLEAESDWRARLWNSLMKAQGAVIDIADLTQFVDEEIGIAVNALGPQRVIFVGVAPQTEEEVRRLAEGHLKQLEVERPQDPLHVVVWPTKETLKPSRRQLSRFRSQMRRSFRSIRREEEILLRPVPTRLGAIRHLLSRDRKATKLFIDFIAIQIGFVLAGLMLGLIVRVLVSGEQQQQIVLACASAPFMLLFLGIILDNWGVYMSHVGVLRDRVKAMLALVSLLAIWVIGLAAFVFKTFPSWARDWLLPT
jgi:hypothetical protein